MMQSLDKMLLEWARKQPPEATYDYFNTSTCALCQFLRDTGICSTPHAGGSYWEDGSLPYGQRVEVELSATVQDGLEERPHTYGSLVARIEQAA